MLLSITLTILISLNLQLRALHDPLRIAKHQLDTEVCEGHQVVDGMLRVTALGVVTHLLPGLLLPTSPGAVLDSEVVAMAACHVVAQGLPAHRHLFGLDVHHFQPPWAVHRFWNGGAGVVSINQGNQLDLMA